MKKTFLIILAVLFLGSAVFAVEENKKLLGIKFVVDKGNAYVGLTLEGSEARNTGLLGGEKLLYINETKITRKHKVNDLISLCSTDPVIFIIQTDGVQKELKIFKTSLPIENPKFLSAWMQVVPQEYEKSTLTNSNKKYSRALKNDVSLINYWAKRKDSFKSGYDFCKNLSEKEQSACLISLIDRNVAQTNADEQRIIQERQLQALQQANYLRAQQNYTQAQTNNNLNNINTNLQQRNYQQQNTNYQLQNINNYLRYGY